MVCRISKSITLCAVDLSSLKLLSLTNAPDAQDRDLELIASICHGLETIDISGTQITDEGLHHLAPKEKGSGEGGVGKGCPNVRAIHFYNTRIGDDGIALCLSKWHALETVGVSAFISTRLVREMRSRRIKVEGYDEDSVQVAKGEEGETSWWDSLFGCA